MSVLNRLGNAAQGTVTVSVDGQVPAPFVGVTAGNPRWRTDSLLICQTIRDIGGATKARLEQWDLTNPDAPLQVVSERGQNFMFAGGGNWAAWDNSYYDCFGPVLGVDQSDWAPLAVDQLTGTIAVTLHRSQGRGLGIWNGISVIEVDPSSILPEACFKDGVLQYKVPGGVYGIFGTYCVPGVTMPAPSQVPVRGVAISQGIRLGFQDDKGLVLFGWNSTSALQIHTPGEPYDQDFAFDVQTFSGTRFKAVSARREGQLPNDLRVYDVDTATSTVNGQPRAWVNLLAVTPEPPNPEPPNPEPPNPEPPEPDMPYPSPKDLADYKNKIAKAGHAIFPDIPAGGDPSTGGPNEPDGFWQSVNEMCDRINIKGLPWQAYSCLMNRFMKPGSLPTIFTHAQQDQIATVTSAIDTECLQRR